MDLLKNGTGTSVADYRRAGVDAKAVDVTMQMVRTIAGCKNRISKALTALRDEDVLYLAYLVNITVPANLFGWDLCEAVLTVAENEGVSVSLVGEMLRRFPDFLCEVRDVGANKQVEATLGGASHLHRWLRINSKELFDGKRKSIF